MNELELYETYRKLDHKNKRNTEQYLLKDIYKESLFKTAKYLLRYEDLSVKTHGPICDALEADTRRKLIVTPRGAFKSSLCSIAYPVWILMNQPNARILLDSAVYLNARNFLKEIKGHLESFPFVSVFGVQKSEADWTQSTITIATRTRNLKEASITAGGIGTQKTSMHFDYIIADDLNNADNSNTPDKAQKVVDHYKYYTSLLEPEGTIAIVGTRYSASDVIGHVLENEIEAKNG